MVVKESYYKSDFNPLYYSEAGYQRLDITTAIPAATPFPLVKFSPSDRIESINIVYTSAIFPGKVKLHLGVSDVENKNLFLKDYLAEIDPAAAPFDAVIKPDAPKNILTLSAATKAIDSGKGEILAHPRVQPIQSIAFYLTGNKLLTTTNSNFVKVNNEDINYMPHHIWYIFAECAAIIPVGFKLVADVIHI